MKTRFLFNLPCRSLLFLALALLTFVSLTFGSTGVGATSAHCGVWGVMS